ncbi:MAG: glycosyltransferase family 4 protein [Candidatus Bathyarchaeia archaeon]
MSFVYKRPFERFEEIHLISDIVWIDDLTKDLRLKIGRKTMKSLIAVLNVIFKIKRFMKYDAIYVPSESWAQVIGFIVSRLCKIPFIVRMRGSPFLVRSFKQQRSEKRVFARLLSVVFDKIDEFTLSKADLIISTAHYLTREISKINGNVVTIWNGVDKKFFVLSPIPPGGRSKDVIFGYIGRVSIEKGLDLLFNAIEGIPVKLRIFGALEYDAVFPENVEYMGHISHEKIEEAYGLFDVLILPSFTEGLPRVLQEAMLLGKPIICTNVGDNHLIVDEGGGWVCNPCTEELRNAILEAIKTDKARLRSMGYYNRRKGEIMFYTWEEYTEKVKHAIRQLAQKRKKN